jgi:hypothetical protein
MGRLRVLPLLAAVLASPGVGGGSARGRTSWDSGTRA